MRLLLKGPVFSSRRKRALLTTMMGISRTWLELTVTIFYYAETKQRQYTKPNKEADQIEKDGASLLEPRGYFS